MSSKECENEAKQIDHAPVSALRGIGERQQEALVAAIARIKELEDINSREFLMLALLAIAVLAMGLFPKPFTDVMDVSVADLLKHVAISKLPQ